MASIQDLRNRRSGYAGTKPWRARYRDPSGREHARHFPRKVDAQRWLDSVTAEIVRGDYVDPRRGRTTFGAWCDEYLAGSHHKRPTTLARDVYVADHYLRPVLGSRHLASITPLDVKRLVDEMAEHLAPATVRTNYGVLRTILNAAVDGEIISRSPCRKVKLPSQSRSRIRFLTADELDRLAAATPIEYRPTIYLAGALGLRLSEVLGLRVGRIDADRQTVEITETVAEVEGRPVFADVKSAASRRTLRMPPFLAEMVMEHIARGGKIETSEALVFEAPDGGPVRATNFRNRVFRPAVEKAGLDGVTFHSLRHSAAGLMIAVGAHIEAIKQRMGHSSIRVTSDVYGSLLPSVDDSVTDSLENLFPRTRRPAADPPVEGPVDH